MADRPKAGSVVAFHGDQGCERAAGRVSRVEARINRSRRSLTESG
jgi:hypothetical protein